jgi:hypothetical protein
MILVNHSLDKESASDHPNSHEQTPSTRLRYPALSREIKREKARASSREKTPAKQDKRNQSQREERDYTRVGRIRKRTKRGECSNLYKTPRTHTHTHTHAYTQLQHHRMRSHILTLCNVGTTWVNVQKQSSSQEAMFRLKKSVSVPHRKRKQEEQEPRTEHGK